MYALFSARWKGPGRVSAAMGCQHRNPLAFDPEESMAADPREPARTQALCWLLDELFDAEDDLLPLVARPGALAGWRRERLGEFCERVGEALNWKHIVLRCYSESNANESREAAFKSPRKLARL
jgi:hypothetical protein